MSRNTFLKMEAHRGVMTEAPENTLAAFRLAARQGYDIIELDPRFTRDGVCVLMHDPTVNRTCRVAGKMPGETPIAIRDLDYADFAAFDAGMHFSPAYAGEPVPTLLSVIGLARQTGIGLRLDRKFEFDQFGMIFDIIDKYGEGVTFSLGNSDLDALRIFAAKYPHFAVHYDGPCTEEALETLASFGCAQVNVWCCLDGNPTTAWYPYPKLDRERADMVRAFGFGLGIWEIETEEQLAAALAYQPDFLETPGNIKPQIHLDIPRRI